MIPASGRDSSTDHGETAVLMQPMEVPREAEIHLQPVEMMYASGC